MKIQHPQSPLVNAPRMKPGVSEILSLPTIVNNIGCYLPLSLSLSFYLPFLYLISILSLSYLILHFLCIIYLSHPLPTSVQFSLVPSYSASHITYLPLFHSIPVPFPFLPLFSTPTPYHPTPCIALYCTSYHYFFILPIT